MVQHSWAISNLSGTTLAGPRFAWYNAIEISHIAAERNQLLGRLDSASPTEVDELQHHH
jgi:hypothetical protein